MSDGPDATTLDAFLGGRLQIRQPAKGFRSGLDAAEKLFDGKNRPTAIFACNDDMAVGAMKALHDAGKRLPQDVSLFGFDDEPSDAYFSMITYMQQRYYNTASRYTTSAFMRLKLGDALSRRAVAPHIFETPHEARAFVASRTEPA